MNGSIGSPAEQTRRSSEQRLLAILQNLVNELRDGGGGVRMDSHLDRDLGLDSLARVELLLRLEREFGASLPEGVLVEAETPHDLLMAFGAAAGLADDNEAWQPLPRGAVQSHSTPAGATTLMVVLEWHARGAPEQVYVHLYNGDGPAMPLTYYDVYEDARRLAGGLRARGVAPGQAVALMLPTGREFIAAFFGVLLAGAVPAPLYPPVRRSAMEEHARRQAAILNNCEAPVFITLPEVRTLSPLLKGLAPGLRAVVTVEELMTDAQSGERPARAAGDIALLQYTSGSTGAPKGVILTPANLLATIRAMGAAHPSPPRHPGGRAQLRIRPLRDQDRRRGVGRSGFEQLARRLQRCGTGERRDVAPLRLALRRVRISRGGASARIWARGVVCGARVSALEPRSSDRFDRSREVDARRHRVPVGCPRPDDQYRRLRTRLARPRHPRGRRARPRLRGPPRGARAIPRALVVPGLFPQPGGDGPADTG